MSGSINAILDARGAFRPRFSPDGRTLFFCTDRTGTVQLWRFDRGGDEPRQLSQHVDRVGGYRVSPDGHLIAFGADLGGDERWQLHVVGAHGAGQRGLTSNAGPIRHLVDWMPGGRELVFFANERDERYFDLHLLALEEGRGRLHFRHDGTGVEGAVLAGGRIVARVDRDRSDRNHLVLVEPDGRSRTLTPRDPPALHAHVRPFAGALLARSDRGRDLVGVARIGLDGRYAPLVTVDHDVEEIDVAGRRWTYAVNVDGESEVHSVDERGDRLIDGLPPGGLYGDLFGDSLTIGGDGSVAIAWARYDAPVAVYVARPGRPAELAVPPLMEGVPGSALPRAERVSWRSFDGREIPGFLLRPREASAGPRPTVVQVHGGPEGQARPLWDPLAVSLVAAGFNVLQPNVRGSSGYGREYMSLDDVRLRFDSVRDVAAAAAWLIDAGVAPADRIGVMGGSYGGFMTLAAIAFFPERWAAAVEWVGIASFVTFLERTASWRRPLREAEYGTIERDREFLERLSPLSQVDRIRAPLMVIHGANDPRVPVQEAEQIVAALRARGREIEYLRYEDEGHGLAKAANRADAWPKVVAFFERHLRPSAIK